jgi:cytochrome c-type biogenesis protein CcmH/NrfG
MGRSSKKKSKQKTTKAAAHGASLQRGPNAPADPRVQKAQVAWQRREYEEAIRLYERALDRAPTNAVLMVDLARAYALRYRYAEAETLVERACGLYPDNSKLQLMLGRSFQMLQQFDKAIDCFQRGLELDPTSPERAKTLYEMTRMYERLHKLDDARQCALESLSLEPHQPVLQYVLGVVERRASSFESAMEHFQNVTSSATATVETMADAWYQLASMADAHGKLAEGYDAACAAKRVLEKVAGPYRYDAADIQRTSRRTVASTSTDHFARWHIEGDGYPPLGRGLAILTSHPRSGTTLLEQVLDCHRDLISADELQVMADIVYLPLCQGHPIETPVPQILDHTPRERIIEVRDQYWRAMNGALRTDVADRVLLDKNPALTGLLPVIARVFPEMKIIFALRDPRDVVVSCFMQQLPLNPVSVHFLTLEQTAAHYADAMHAWLKFRQIIKNPWIEVRYENVVADIPTETRRVLEFLGLEWDEAVLNYRDRAQRKHVHSPTYEAVTKPVYTTSIGRWRHYAAQLDSCLPTLQPYIDAFGYAD